MTDLLERQILAEVASALAAARSSSVGDSPIERLLFDALRAAAEYRISAVSSIVATKDDAELAKLLATPTTEALIVRPQAHACGWRVDFLVYGWGIGKAGAAGGWRKLIVECDGHHFHERTKEQAARDRSRDRAAELHGYSLLRFTGSEIHANPLGCALQVSRWALQGWS